jgi:hypothetical protein
MPLTCDEIGTLVTRIQAVFLETPDLRLTLDQAERRFHIDRLTCEAVLGALVDGHVLNHLGTGNYRRRFPARNHVSGSHRVMAATGAAA